MNNNIVLLSEKCKTDKRLYKELSKLVEIEESEVLYFINQFKKDTFYKCLTTFVKFYSKGNIFHCLFTCDSHCEIYISFFQSFPYMNDFQYKVEMNIETISHETMINFLIITIKI